MIEGDTIFVNTTGLSRDEFTRLMSLATATLKNHEQLQQKLGGKLSERFRDFGFVVIEILTGESKQTSEVLSRGLDPVLVRSTAKSILARSMFFNGSIGYTLPGRMVFGTSDPHDFLG